jgi:A/G-specific adenine glycosylase
VPPALGEAVARRVVSALQSSEPVRQSTFGNTLRAWLRQRGGPLPAPGGQNAAWAILLLELCIPRQATAIRQRRLRTVLEIAHSPHAAVERSEAVAEIVGVRAAQRLVDAAQAVIVRHGGSVPSDEALLLGLPRVGAHAAAAIRSFGFGERTVPVNEGARRVVRRVTGLTVSSIWTNRLELLRMAGADGPDVIFNAALQQLTEEICTATDPSSGQCPVLAECRDGRRRVQYRRPRPADI